MADLATAVNGLAMEMDPTIFLTGLSSMQPNAMLPFNPALSPAQPPVQPPGELSWYNTFMAQQPGGGQQKPSAASPTTPAFGPQQLAALQALMPKQSQWPPAAAVAPRGPAQVQFAPIGLPQIQPTPRVPSFAGLFGR